MELAWAPCWPSRSHQMFASKVIASSHTLFASENVCIPAVLEYLRHRSIPAFSGRVPTFFFVLSESHL